MNMLETFGMWVALICLVVIGLFCAAILLLFAGFYGGCLSLYALFVERPSVVVAIAALVLVFMTVF